MSQNIGVYVISSPSGKVYIGMTATSFEGRWNGHLKDLRTKRHKCLGLQRAYNKYGEDSLKFEILETLNNESQSVILLKGQEWWDKLKLEGISLYNGRPTGTGSVHHTDETRLKISKAMKKYADKNRKPSFIDAICEICKNSFIKSRKALKDSVLLNAEKKIFILLV